MMMQAMAGMMTPFNGMNEFSSQYASAVLLDTDAVRRGTILFDCHPDVGLRVK